jgi:hypothetical protein
VDPLPGARVFPALDRVRAIICGLEPYDTRYRFASEESGNCVSTVFPYLLLDGEEKRFNIECGS